jgi:NAD(P)-dependent dehydrogenase (short-subunit alcohol dehydrogenase family)
MNIGNKTILITGANRGIGRALLDEALRRGAKNVYAGTRSALQHSDKRVTPLTLDVTNSAQIQGAIERVETLDILINNAGLALYDDLSDRGALEQSLAVNLFGPYGVIQAFLPLLTRSRGTIVNVLSLAALAALPFTPAYSISKAAAFSLTQSLRALLAAQGMSFHAVLAGPVDTDMSRGLDATVRRWPPRRHSLEICPPSSHLRAFAWSVCDRRACRRHAQSRTPSSLAPRHRE